MRQFRPCIRMHTTTLGIALGLLSGVVALTIGSSAAWADSCATPANGPSGPDAPAFTYQCDGAQAGKWISPYYVYDPATTAESPLYNETYRYDCASETWQQNDWEYDSASASYAEQWVATASTPDQSTDCPTATAESTTTTPTDGDAKDTTSNTTGAAASNTVDSTSQSGGATVAQNGQAGDATSGNSSTETTVSTVVGSTGNPLGSGVVVFTQDIDHPVDGDIILDPSDILPTGIVTDGQSPAAITGSTDTSTSNTITASASSGNASVSGNGDAGDATSGDADAIVNLINIINSAIASGQSFIGTINIYSDLNGNILIPQSVVDQLLASNGVASGAGPAPDSTDNSVDDDSIVNNVSASAISGNATITGNGQAGDATSGDAGTNVTILNLTGSSVIGKNVLLVFVNVLGTWVGMIVNAPVGSTSAEFGGGVTSTTLSSNNGSPAEDTIASITNNVTASATSGDAMVADNQNAGSAKSGNAYTGVNILNMENSQLDLANWFGILFINVFGTWNGSFGIQPAPAPAAPTGSDPDAGESSAAAAPADHHFASFLPHGITAGTTSGQAGDGAILGDATAAPAPEGSAAPLGASESGKHANYILAIIGVSLAALLLLAAERDKLLSRR